jgi:hypothetical protein
MTDETKPMALFRRRKRIAGAAFLIWGVIGLFRAPFFVTRWPNTANWLFWSFVIGGLPVCCVFIWAWRCTVCGGGIKLDGRTCGKCGRVFK